MNFDKSGDTQIDPTVILKSYKPDDIVIGKGTWIGAFCYLNGYGGIELGRCVGIGPHCTILSSEHDLYADVDRPIIHAPLKVGKVTLKDGCDIGAGCVILPGVTVGFGAMVAAGMVVREDVEDYAVVRHNQYLLWKYRKDEQWRKI